MIDTGMMEVGRPAAAGTEGGRRPTGVPAAAGAKIRPGNDSTTPNAPPVRPDPQVVERPVRRTFTKPYKREILRQIDACTKDGQVGEILRRLEAWWIDEDFRPDRDAALRRLARTV